MNNVATLDAQLGLIEIAGCLDCSIPSAVDEPEEVAAGIYRPGAYYFRRDLRGSATRGRAIEIARVVRGEIERTWAWLKDTGEDTPGWITPSDVPALSGQETRDAAIAVGLIIIGALERQRAWLRERDLPVPKWIVSPDERDVRDWPVAPDKASA